MLEQLVPKELLQKADKILFLTHLALGDFTYMQNYFKAFAQKYPHMKIDLWVDEQRGKAWWRRWKKNSGKYVLYDWLESCSFFNKIYKQSGSWQQLRNFLDQVKNQNYPIVVCLTDLKSYNFVKYAQLISPKGFIVGAIPLTKRYNFLKKRNLKKLDAFFLWQDFLRDNNHISDSYAALFEKLFGLIVKKEERLPFVNLPQKWSIYGKLKFLKWGIYQKGTNHQKTIFINSCAKTKKRCWSISNVIELIDILRSSDEFYDSNFIINILPYQVAYFKKYFKNFAEQKIFFFTADVSFFQLPAIISLCDLVISVETSIIHLAAALKVPVISIMRQKNPEWIPCGSKSCVVNTKNRKDWVEDISVKEVVFATQSFFKDLCKNL